MEPPRPLLPEDAKELLLLVEALATHHNEVTMATVATLARDLTDGWMWGFGIGRPL
ncbi:MAG: hypothetical protein WBA25_03615 [Jannaschia sp.]